MMDQILAGAMAARVCLELERRLSSLKYTIAPEMLYRLEEDICKLLRENATTG